MKVIISRFLGDLQLFFQISDKLLHNYYKEPTAYFSSKTSFSKFQENLKAIFTNTFQARLDFYKPKETRDRVSIEIVCVKNSCSCRLLLISALLVTTIADYDSSVCIACDKMSPVHLPGEKGCSPLSFCLCLFTFVFNRPVSSVMTTLLSLR